MNQTLWLSNASWLHRGHREDTERHRGIFHKMHRMRDMSEYSESWIGENVDRLIGHNRAWYNVKFQDGN